MNAEEIIKRYNEVHKQMESLGEVITDYNNCSSAVSKKFLEKAMEGMAKSIRFVEAEVQG